MTEGREIFMPAAHRKGHEVFHRYWNTVKGT